MPIFKKIMNRSLSLIACQDWYSGERKTLPKICRQAMYFDPIFIYKKNKGVSIYYNISDPNQNPELLVKYFNQHQDRFTKIASKYQKDCDLILKLIKENKISNIKKISKKIISLWGGLVASNIIGGYEDKIDQKLKKKAYDTRANSDKIMYQAEEALLNLIIKKTRKKIPILC